LKFAGQSHGCIPCTSCHYSFAASADLIIASLAIYRVSGMPYWSAIQHPIQFVPSISAICDGHHHRITIKTNGTSLTRPSLASPKPGRHPRRRWSVKGGRFLEFVLLSCLSIGVVVFDVPPDRKYVLRVSGRSSSGETALVDLQ